MTIRTTSDHRTWFVNASYKETDEVVAYIDSLNFNDEEVRIVFINLLPNPIVSVNGISIQYDTEELKSEFDTFVTKYRVSEQGNKVDSLYYYADRKTVEIIYDNHPLDPAIPNTRHDIEDVKDVIEPAFNSWKVNAEAIWLKAKEDREANQSFE